MRTIKVALLLAVASFALGVSASSALANEFTAKEYPVRVTGKQSGITKFIIGSGTTTECEAIENKTAEPEFLTGPSFTWLFKEFWSKCKSGFVGIEITWLSGMLLLLTWSGTKLIWKLRQSFGTTGGIITIKWPTTGCQVNIPSGQEFTEGVGAKNIAGGKIEAEFIVKKIKYSSNEIGAGCPKNGEEAALEGKQVFEGFNELGGADPIEIK